MLSNYLLSWFKIRRMRKLIITYLIMFPVYIIAVMGVMYLGEPELRNDFSAMLFKAIRICFPIILILFYLKSRKLKKKED